MDAQTSICAVVLGGPDHGLAVYASSEAGPLGPAVEQLMVTGPVLATAAAGAVTTVNDADDTGGRWPAWAGGARDSGYRGMRSWPVQVAASPIGALVVLSTNSWSPAAGQGAGNRSTPAGQALADVCALILQLPGPSQRWAQAVLNLQAATERDVVVHQAVGMIAAAHDVDIPAAAAALAASITGTDGDAVALALRVVTREVRPQDGPLA